MQDVKWIKLYTDFPNSRKVKQIMKIPNGPVYICVWVFLMCLAGDVNDNGALYFTEELPYTDEMLADQFDLPVKVVRLALQIFEKFKMIEIIDDAYRLKNWEKYQDTDRLSNIKEQDRIRAKEYRARKKLAMKSADNNVTRHVTRHAEIGDSHATDKERESDIDLSLTGESSAPAHESVYGVYKNVLLTDDALAALRMDFPTEWQRMIDNLSTYMQTHGTEYADHDAVMRKWAAEDAKKKKAKPGSGGNAFGYEAQREYSSEEMDELELKMRLRRTGDQEGAADE